MTYRDFFSVSNVAEAEDAKTFARQTNERERAEAPRDHVRVHVPGAHRVEFRDGAATYSTTTVQSAHPKSRDLGPDMVRLRDGNITPYQAAQAAGLLDHIVEYGASGRDPIAYPTTAAHRPQPQQDDGRHDDAQNHHAKDREAAAPVDDADNDFAPTPSEEAAIRESMLTLETAEQVLGREAVDAMTTDAVAHGELPKDLPAEMQAEVQKVVDGYVTEANVVLRSTGANVALLDEVLTDDELRSAREAAFSGDDKTLKKLGALAIRRLQHLPDDNPRMFKQLIAELPAQAKVVQRNGRPWVITPGWSMPWAQAVAESRIGF